MDIFDIFVKIINIVFAGLGIVFTVETLRLRSSTRRSKSEIVECTEDYSDFKDPFNKGFAESRLGSQVVEAEYLYKDRKFTPNESKIIQTYRNHAYIRLTRLFHQNGFWDEKENHLLFVYYQMALIMLPAFLLSFFEASNNVFLFLLVFLFVILFLTPFGIYGDAEEDSKSKSIFSFFSLGRVKRVRCIIEEQGSSDFICSIYFNVNFLGLPVKIPRTVKAQSIENAVFEYLTAKSFANPIDDKFSYRCIGVNEIEKTTHVFINDFRYGWMRVVHLISSLHEKVANKLARR